ncbi:4'-phosphopantetheinyl transferase family protein [Fibrivirga algicola]|uniref:4'-phosphopantetheinyl transferase superfamily protein n=1 Tax=Fibrivirga algicola TaxID=2950420 RepID=A0ABX0QJM8_9BACT|nr:4'-phosphopantetheinyl transferase superfamily protein [Fibrivirga algicola]NID11385.1 4'-phosphopantetheinyl transferase superfamily protein [Fibrivirga algicola]
MSERSPINPVDVQWERWSSELQPSLIAVVRYRINSADQSRFYGLLSLTEKERANRFVQLADKQRFTAGRGLLRLVAGQLTQTPPNQIDLLTGPFGKPELVFPVASQVDWQVNVSHAGEWVVLAVGYVPVGIDVEWINPDWPYQDLIPIMFDADDQACLAASADPRTLFYTFWTRKESLLKATGEGLINDLTCISSSKGIYKVESDQLAGVETWRTMSFLVSDGYVGAVACPEGVTVSRFFTIDTTQLDFAYSPHNGAEN